MAIAVDLRLFYVMLVMGPAVARVGVHSCPGVCLALVLLSGRRCCHHALRLRQAWLVMGAAAVVRS